MKNEHHLFNSVEKQILNAKNHQIGSVQILLVFSMISSLIRGNHRNCLNLLRTSLLVQTEAEINKKLIN